MHSFPLRHFYNCNPAANTFAAPNRSPVPTRSIGVVGISLTSVGGRQRTVTAGLTVREVMAHPSGQFNFCVVAAGKISL